MPSVGEGLGIEEGTEDAESEMGQSPCPLLSLGLSLRPALGAVCSGALGTAG